MCDLSSNRLDISIVIDTSGSQIGNKQVVVAQFVKDLIKQFDTQTVVKVSITAVGDHRNGEVDVILGPAQFGTESELQAAIDAITWLDYMAKLNFLRNVLLHIFFTQIVYKVYSCIGMVELLQSLGASLPVRISSIQVIMLATFY